MTTMYSPGEVRKLKAERDELLEAAKEAVRLHAAKYVHEYLGVYEDAMQVLAEAVERAEGRE